MAGPDPSATGGARFARTRQSHLLFGPALLGALLRRLAAAPRDDDDVVWRPIARLAGNTHAAKQCLREAVDALDAAEVSEREPQPSLRALLRGYDIAGRPRAAVAAELGLTEREFGRRRRDALERLCAALCRALETRQHVGLRVVDPLALELAVADAHEAALAPRAAATKLEAMLGGIGAAARGRVAARLAVAICRTGDIRRAHEALHLARGAAADVNTDSRFETELDLAELRVASVIEDAPRFERALSSMAQRARAADAGARESYGDALSEAGQRALWDVDIPKAAQVLGDLDRALLRLDRVPGRLAAMSHLLWASVHSGTACANGLARLEATRALEVAVGCSQVRVGWQALFFLVNTLFDSPDECSRRARLGTIRRYAQYLLDVAASGGDASFTHEAKMLLAAATWRLDEHAPALAILNAEPASASPRALLVRDLIRAGMFVQLGRSAESFDDATRAVTRATQLGHVGHIGIAELYRSRAAAALGMSDDAMQFALTAVERLSAARDPLHLLAAYDQLHTMSGDVRFRRRERQLRGELRRVSGPVTLTDAPLLKLPALSRVAVPPAGLDTLTPRQREVLALLGEGCTNRAIAGRLRIAEKTVDHHVSAVLAKLGLRSRWQAGSVLVRAAATD